jgi:hypothetical protein
LTKCVPARPSRVASRFICSTNFSSLPAMSSASAIDASLPDWMMTPCRSSSTVTALRGSMNMREPSAFHARCDTSTICDGVMVFARRAAKTQ